jgi:hypothetical protein
VAAADLHLDPLHDPAGALRLYQRARSGSGALREQVLWGIARSRRALGDREERSALRDYLAAFPSGLFAAQASARLAELDPK